MAKARNRRAGIDTRMSLETQSTIAIDLVAAPGRQTGTMTMTTMMMMMMMTVAAVPEVVVGVAGASTNARRAAAPLQVSRRQIHSALRRRHLRSQHGAEDSGRWW